MQRIDIQRFKIGVLKYESVAVFSISLYLLYSLLWTISANLNIGNNIINYLCLGTSYALLFICVLMKRSKALRCSFLLLFAIVLLFVFSMILFPENGNIFIRGFALQYGVTIMPFVCLLDMKSLNKVIYIYALISFISSIVELVPFFRNGGYWITNYGNAVLHVSYNMTLGYEALVSGLLFYWIYKEKKNPLFFIFSVLGIAISLIWGARGCLLCYIIYFVLYLAYRKKSYKTMIRMIIMIFILLIVYLFGIQNILIALSNVLGSFGISSRTISSITALTKIIGNDSGRGEIWSILIRKMWERPVLGYGIMGDRYLLNQYLSSSVTLYSHNLFIEILISFGIPIGLSIIAFMINQIIKAIKKSKKDRVFWFYICLLAFNMGNLMVSNSIWYSTGFWFFIGFVIVINTSENFMIEAET